MDINKVKKVRNSLRLQFGGGISKYDTYWNIDQVYPPITPGTLQEITIIDKKPILKNVQNPIKNPSQSLPHIDNKIIQIPTIDIETLDKHQDELDEKLTFWEKIKSGRFDDEKMKDLKEKNPEEYEKRYKSSNQSAEQAISGVGTMTTNIGQIFNANQQSTDSNLTKSIDAGYDAISDGLTKLGPIGKISGTGMKVLETLGDIGQEYLGTGTDQQSTLDKWMDSPLFSWNVGLLNGAAGKNTDSFAIDQNTVAKVGSSYGGSINTLNDAAEKAGKEYGLFSWKSRKKANDVIVNAKTMQNTMSNIADVASDQRLAVQSMGEQAGLAYSMMTNGGFDQKYTYAAKEGGLLEWHPVIKLNQELSEYKEGGELPELLKWAPKFQKGVNIRTIEELIEYAKKENPRFIQRLSEEPKGIKFIDDEGNEAEGSHYLESRGEYVIPRIQEVNGKLQFFNSQDAFNKALETGNYLKLNPEEAIIFAEQYKQGWPDFFKKFKKGGSVGESDIPEIEETAQKNVIPEGALHKNKHHMEHAEGLTKKGIPVIDNDGEQQAEIEHSEIIFTLEVTKKLEEYYNIFYSDESSNKEKEQAAIDAGKLLVYQILENTDDRTNLIESCKDGGTLKLKKSTDDLIEEVLEWVPQIIIIEEETKEEPKDKKKYEKEEMKETIKEVLIELLAK